MNPETPKPKALIVTSWIFLLLASGLPRIVLQEVFKYQVSADLGALIAGSVVLIGFILTFLWGASARIASVLYPVPRIGRGGMVRVYKSGPAPLLPVVAE